MALSSISSNTTVACFAAASLDSAIVASEHELAASHAAFFAKLPKRFSDSFECITGKPVPIQSSQATTIADERKTSESKSQMAAAFCCSQKAVSKPINRQSIGPIAEIIADIKKYNSRTVPADAIDERMFRNIIDANQREVLEVNSSPKWEERGVLPRGVYAFGFDGVPGNGVSWIGNCENLTDAALGMILSTKSGPSGKYVALYMLSHGHYDESCSVFLRKHLPLHLEKTLLPVLDKPDKIYNVLKKTFVQLNRDYRKSPKIAKYIGATVIAAIVIDSDLYIANVGNCAAFLSHNGEAIGLSNEPSPCNPHYREGVLIRGGKIIENNGRCAVCFYDVSFHVTRVIGHSERLGVHARANITKYSLDSPYMGRPDGQDYLILTNSEVAAAASRKQMARTIQELAKQGLDSLQIAQNLLGRVNHVFLETCRNASLIVIPVADIKAKLKSPS